MIAGVTFSNDRTARTEVRTLQAAVNRRLEALLPARRQSDELGAALRYSLLAPGKRIRPLLTVLAAWEFGQHDLAALDAGCALEMVHTASLILDDMPAMDDALERRGQPATHVRFGEDVAMLAAITLLNQAYATLAGMREVDASVRCLLITTLTNAVGLDGLASGQYADLRDATGGVTGMARANQLKTGALFVAAVEMAAAIRRTNEATAHTLRLCGSELGQAFQLLDDLIDGTAREPGARQEDFGKATLLSMLGQQEVRMRLGNHVRRSLQDLQPHGPLACFVRSIFANGIASLEAV